MALALFTIRNDLFFRTITTFIKTEGLCDQRSRSVLSRTRRSKFSLFGHEDKHGTHIFSNNDLNMMTKLSELVEHGFDHWKLDGVYCPGENFVKITEYFVKARDLIQKEHLHRIKPICLMKKSANYIQLIVVWILVSMIMNQIV